MRISIGIVDDEENARRVIRKYLERYFDDYTVLFESEDFQDAIDMCLKHRPDILFLDIHLLDGSGLDIARVLREEGCTAKIIFSTAYHEYAIQAIKLQAKDYILKPVDPDEFKDAVQRVFDEVCESKKNQGEEATKIAISTLSGTQLIEQDDVLYAKADGSYCEIHLKNGKSLTISRPLKFIEQQVESNSNFLKIHKSFLINMKWVEFLDRTNNEITLLTKVKLPIARSNMKMVFQAFQKR